MHGGDGLGVRFDGAGASAVLDVPNAHGTVKSPGGDLRAGLRVEVGAEDEVGVPLEHADAAVGGGLGASGEDGPDVPDAYVRLIS